MKNLSLAKSTFRFYVLLAVSVVLIFFAVCLLMQIQSLSSQISTLKDKSNTLSVRLNEFERSLCSNSDSLKPTDTLAKYTMQSAGYARTYQVHTPDHYDPSVRYPVVLSFDGIDGSGTRMEKYSGLDALPAILVYPDSLPGKKGFTSWAGAPYSLEGDQDIQFVREILDSLPSNYCVDSTRIFAVGMSNGGSFATIVGCDLGSRIRAVASISGAYYSTCQEEERTPSLLIIHSSDDQQVPFKGSVSRRLPQISRWTDDQAMQRHCRTIVPATTTNSTHYFNWLDCNDNSILRLVVLNKQRHGWLEIPQVPKQDAGGSAGYIWEFFEQSTFNG